MMNHSSGTHASRSDDTMIRRSRKRMKERRTRTALTTRSRRITLSTEEFDNGAAELLLASQLARTSRIDPKTTIMSKTFHLRSAERKKLSRCAAMRSTKSIVKIKQNMYMN